jgi:hypothetical protein
MIHPGLMFLLVVAVLYVTGPGKTNTKAGTIISTGTVSVEKSTDTTFGYNTAVSTGVVISTETPVSKIGGAK